MTHIPPDAADGRAGDIRRAALDTLRGHQPLVDALETPAAVDAGRGPHRIVPAPDLSMAHHSDGDAPEVALAIGTPITSSQPLNAYREKDFTIEADFQVSESALRSVGAPVEWHDDVIGAVSAVLTTDITAWIARGVSGSNTELEWNDQIGRRQTIKNYRVRRYD